MEFWGHGGVFTIGNPKALGNSTGGISGVESVTTTTTTTTTLYFTPQYTRNKNL